VLVRDELAALFMNMSRYSGGQDDEFWLESWNGEPHTVERMGRMLSVDHLLIGVVGGMQPDKLVASFEGDHDGKYARVLFAWPDEPGWLGLNNDANKTTMKASIRLVRDYFWPHARACLRLIGLTERHTNARRALLWIRAKGKTEVSREEIRRDALSQRLDATETTALLTTLCASGWLWEEVTAPGPQGGKPARRWLVNPKLLKDPVAQTALTAETLP
jgi:hypothetical protein